MKRDLLKEFWKQTIEEFLSNNIETIIYYFWGQGRRCEYLTWWYFWGGWN